MHTIYSIAGLAVISVIIYCVSENNWRRIKIPPALIIAILGLSVRFALISVNAGYENDITCFKQWADSLYQYGFSKFYYFNNGVDFAHDYPPGYMYALYTLGALHKALGLSDAAFTVLVKIPAILCDIITSCIIYRIAARKFKKLPALLFGLAYALNPAIIMDSVIWGQVDSVHTMLLFASILALSEERRLFSYIAMALAVLVKPQSLVLSPIFIYDAVNNVLSPAQISALKRAGIIFIKAVAAILAIVLFSLPFTQNFDLSSIIDKYQKTLSAYPYTSLNAYNLYAFLGLNLKPVSGVILQFDWGTAIKTIVPGLAQGSGDAPSGLTYSMLGSFFLVIISLYGIYLLFRGKGRKSALFVCAGVLFTLTFLLSVMMHERYLYPALVFFLAAYVYTKDKRLLMFYIAYSAIFFVNCSDVLNMVQHDGDEKLIALSMQFVSLINIIITSVLAVVTLRMSIRPQAADRPDLPVIKETAPAYPGVSDSALRLGWRDWLIMAVLTAVYAAAAFYNLGDKTAPQTAWHANANQYATFTLEPDKPVKKTVFFLGARINKRFTLSVSDDGVNWRDVKEFDIDPTKYPKDGFAVFRWVFEETDFTAKYARITSLDNDLFLLELGFLDESGAVIPITLVDGSPPGDGYSHDDPLISQDPAFLCDEQSLIQNAYSFSNSTYFDEIYHARTAYEFIHHLNVYEWTHPPLGKDIISWGILIFGMTPFGWRFMGTLFGVLMLPVIYIFAKKMFRGTDWAFFAAALMTFDFMHFAQTRIATIDSYVTFFIMAMYLFMYLYYSLNIFEVKVKRGTAAAIVSGGNPPVVRFRHSVFARSLVYLMLCGIFTGLAVASKWEGAYAMAGLPVVFFYSFYRRYLEYKTAKAEGDFDEENWNLKYFPVYAVITAVWCLVCFVLIPAVIYTLSYIPYMHTPDHPSILKNQIDMFKYHTELVSTHDFSSYWFEWPVMLRPMYYFAGQLTHNVQFLWFELKSGLSAGITSFGNPAVWWTGIAATLYGVKVISGKFNKNVFFLLVAYASQYLPWILVSRTTYIYHYFPSVPFIILLIAFMFKDWVSPRKPALVILYILLALILFIAFYPALSGFPIPMWYVNTFLRWMPTWNLS